MAEYAKWGSFKWGQRKWGENPGYAYQGQKDNARKDTVYFAQSQTLDLSQYLSDLTASGAHAAYEASSSRCALTAEWNLYHRADYNVGAERDKVLLYHGNDAASDYTFRIKVGASNVECAINGILVVSLAVASGSVDRSISWSMRRNRLTTGASDAMVSEFCVYDHDAGDWELEHEQVYHAAPTTSAAWNFSVHGQWNDGGATMNDILATAVIAVRVSAWFHSHVHVAEDWIAARTPVATAYPVHREPVALTSVFGEEGEILGSQLAYLCAHQRHAVFRGFSPLVNQILTEEYTFKDSDLSGSWYRGLPGATANKMPATFLHWLEVPTTCNELQGRINVRSYVTTGDAVPVKLLIVCMNRPPGVALDWDANSGEPPEFEAYYGHATLEVNHTAGGRGEWVDIGKIKLARCDWKKLGWAGTVHVCLALQFDPDNTSSNDANARLEVRSWAVLPAATEAGQNGQIGDVLEVAP